MEREFSILVDESGDVARRREGHPDGTWLTAGMFAFEEREPSELRESVRRAFPGGIHMSAGGRRAAKGKAKERTGRQAIETVLGSGGTAFGMCAVYPANYENERRWKSMSGLGPSPLPKAVLEAAVTRHTSEGQPTIVSPGRVLPEFFQRSSLYSVQILSSRYATIALLRHLSGTALARLTINIKFGVVKDRQAHEQAFNDMYESIKSGADTATRLELESWQIRPALQFNYHLIEADADPLFGVADLLSHSAFTWVHRESLGPKLVEICEPLLQLSPKVATEVHRGIIVHGDRDQRWWKHLDTSE